MMNRLFVYFSLTASSWFLYSLLFSRSSTSNICSSAIRLIMVMTSFFLLTMVQSAFALSILISVSFGYFKILTILNMFFFLETSSGFSSFFMPFSLRGQRHLIIVFLKKVFFDLTLMPLCFYYIVFYR